jgi:hypothetical protein
MFRNIEKTPKPFTKATQQDFPGSALGEITNARAVDPT